MRREERDTGYYYCITLSFGGNGNKVGAKGIDRINKLGIRRNDEGAIRERGKG